MKSKLNTDNIANELKGASLYFQRPASPVVTQPTSQPSVLKEEADTVEKKQEPSSQPKPNTESIGIISNVRTNERTFERTKVRHSFDVFSDQLVSLRKMLINREEEVGDRVTLGDLVQEALDMFITKEKNKT